MNQHNKSFKTEVQKSRTLLNLIHTFLFSIHFSKKLWGTKTRPGMEMPPQSLRPEIAVPTETIAETRKQQGTPH